MPTQMTEPFEKDELMVWSYRDDYFIDVLNGELSVEEARENLASFRNTRNYKGNNPKFMEVKDEN